LITWPSIRLAEFANLATLRLFADSADSSTTLIEEISATGRIG